MSLVDGLSLAAVVLAAYQVSTHVLWSLGLGPDVQRTRAGYFRGIAFDAGTHALVFAALAVQGLAQGTDVPVLAWIVLGWFVAHLGYVAASLWVPAFKRSHDISSPSLWHVSGERLAWYLLTPKVVLVFADLGTHLATTVTLSALLPAPWSVLAVLAGPIVAAVEWSIKKPAKQAG